MKKNMAEKYNVAFVFLSSFLMAFSGGWGVIQILFYQDLGLDFIEISTIMSTFFIANVIFEIPTGVFADLYGRKTSIMLTFVLCLVEGILLVKAEGFWDVWVVAVLFGLSFSFWSGSFEALLYESLDKLGWREKYSNILAKSSFLFVAIGAITNYYIPIMYGIDNRYPFYLTIGVAIILTTAGSFLTETERITYEPVLKNKFANQIKISLGFILKRDALIFIFTYNAFWATTMGIFASLLNQPLIYERYTLEDYGMIFAATTVLQSAIVFFSNNIINIIKKANPYFVMVLVWSLCLAGMVEFLDNLYLLVPIMAVAWSAGSIVHVLTSNDINNIIDDDEIRATTLSMKSMFTSLVLAAGTALTGGIIESTRSVQVATLTLSIAALLIGITVLARYPKKDIGS